MVGEWCCDAAALLPLLGWKRRAMRTEPAGML